MDRFAAPNSAWTRRLLVACVALASGVVTVTVSRSAQQTVVPSGCTSIKNIPVAHNIEYGAAIQSLFNDYSGMSMGCVDCHFDIDQNPSGNLDLTPGVSWGNLVNIASDEDSNYKYVVPLHPEQSLLFQKINCDLPGVGSRMPLDGYAGGLTAQQQALIYDWIADGAPVLTTDDIFRGSFDIRGFEQ